eukprot:TRINITY_DN28885_c0_g1_i1.p1 TRINITY_DN28885_c0_g1~~TRINITY_DN28885_c0_g1_i1.p1  ORF type:complete len:352 (-),score=79.97 TRINITY_DN28885_c0_g1_i1:23-1078(-)
MAAGTSTLLVPLMLTMLISGTFNTLLMKFMVMQQVPTGPGMKSSGFEYPYFQSLLMMMGEFLCLFAYYLAQDQKQVLKNPAPKYVFAGACLLDWTATTLVNMAYVLIAASVIQMTRGAIVIFTCLFSVVFLGKRQYKHHLVGVFMVFIGITLVSLSTFVNPAQKSSETSAGGASLSQALMGIALCVFAQVFQATMLVYEEKIMSNYETEPLQVVGLEGAFGLTFGCVLLACLRHFGLEDVDAAVYQMQHSTPLAIAVIGSIFSIAFFNFSGVTVTQKASAVARSTIDVSRTILIWAVELYMGWNHFNVLELFGFVILAAGTLIYNELIQIRSLKPPPEAAPLKVQEPFEGF